MPKCPQCLTRMMQNKTSKEWFCPACSMYMSDMKVDGKFERKSILETMMIVIGSFCLISAILFLLGVGALTYSTNDEETAKGVFNLSFSLMILVCIHYFINTSILSENWWKRMMQDHKNFRTVIRRDIVTKTYIVQILQSFYFTILLMCIFSLLFGIILVNIGNSQNLLARGFILIILPLPVIFMVFRQYVGNVTMLSSKLFPPRDFKSNEKKLKGMGSSDTADVDDEEEKVDSIPRDEEKNQE